MNNSKLGKKRLLLSLVAAGVLLCQSASAMESAPSSEGRSLSLFPEDFVTSEFHSFFKQNFEGPLKKKLSEFDINLKLVFEFVGQMNKMGAPFTLKYLISLTKLARKTINSLPILNEEEQEGVFDKTEEMFIQKAKKFLMNWLKLLEEHEFPLY